MQWNCVPVVYTVLLSYPIQEHIRKHRNLANHNGGVSPTYVLGVANTYITKNAWNKESSWKANT